MAKLAICGGKPVFDRRHEWPKWPLASASDERRLIKALREGEWGVGSCYTREFADLFAKSLRVKYALPVGTGTAALELAVKALGIGPGDEVIIPSYTFIATATSVLEMGSAVVFADIDPETFEIDPNQVARLITPRTKAIIPVHFGGNPCDMTALKALTRGRHIAIIEDAAHAHGMKYRGKAGGAIGDMGCFSFQTSKNMTAGEGGALTTPNTRLYQLAWSFHSFGRLPGHEWYEHHYLSWNHRITGLQSAILIGQLERLDQQTRRRYKNGRFLDRALARMPGIMPQKPGDTHAGTRRAYHLYMARYDASVTGVDRALFVDALKAEGVRALTGYPIPLQENPMFREHRYWHRHFIGGRKRKPGEPDYRRVSTPVAKALCGEAIWISQSDLLGSHADMQGIVDVFEKIITRRDELRACSCRGKRR